MTKFEGFELGRVIILNLKRGDLLLETIEEELAKSGIRNALLTSAIGSMQKVVLHRVIGKGREPEDEYITLENPMELASLQGVVLETYGAGNAMTYDWFLNALHKAVKRGIIIVNVTQCLGGSVEMGIYETGNQLSKAGVIGSKDMTTEATVVKLMFLLGQGYSQFEIEKLMLENISGEITIQ